MQDMKELQHLLVESMIEDIESDINGSVRVFAREAFADDIESLRKKGDSIFYVEESTTLTGQFNSFIQELCNYQNILAEMDNKSYARFHNFKGENDIVDYIVACIKRVSERERKNNLSNVVWKKKFQQGVTDIVRRSIGLSNIDNDLAMLRTYISDYTRTVIRAYQVSDE